ncbi:MAG: hypothetical protein DHS20C01_00900 [marine bacterium B5-7]|nr:MAG: hypothetical protein DHS20C01_00900 [marine bacterium B5-7]
MNISKRQAGITIWGTLFTIGVLIFFGLLFMKLFPPYYDNLRIHKGMNLLVDENKVAEMSKREIIRRLNRILLIDYVDEVVDMNKALSITRKDRGIDIEVLYEVKVPLAYNLSALMEFDNVVFAPYQQ